MKTVYLAASWSERGKASAAKYELQRAGIRVVSTWTEQADENDPVSLSVNAANDERELQSADAIILLNLAKSEGKATEWGMARQAGKLCILVGPREGNIFYNLPGIVQCDTLQDAIAYLKPLTFVGV